MKINFNLGATINGSGVDFAVWAPKAKQVDVVISHPGKSSIAMTASDDGVFRVHVPHLNVGTRYKYKLDGDAAYADPYSRYQPEGPHHASMVVNCQGYEWQDHHWRGIELRGQVIYELHIGAFTEQGTFDAASEKLTYLRSIGVTTIELMPVAEFPGDWNWGYDGVNLFAPFHGYGDYDALKRFVDRAHHLGLGVILDVVYNHIGPSGNYLPCFSDDYFSSLHKNEWGTPFNFDGENSARVREFVIANACEWIREFHLDGLRLDATSAIVDDSEYHLIAEMTEQARLAAGERKIIIVAEDEQQHASRLLPRAHGGFGLDAMWNDDFHHSVRAAITGRRHAYFFDYTGRAQEFISAVKRGFLFQGQFYHWQKQPRGERFRTSADSCITFTQNHDQVANSVNGKRLHLMTSPARYRAVTALLLLAPQTPLLFMGQEFNASSPFLFFADHEAGLRDAVFKGRREFLAQFPSVASVDSLAAIKNPADVTAFEDSKLKWQEVEQNATTVQLYKDLLELRRSDPVIRLQDAKSIDGAVLSDQALVLRWFNDEYGDRLLVINLGQELELRPGPEPLLAPSPHSHWALLWSSERLRYGGIGVEHPEIDYGWRLPAESAVLLQEQSLISALYSDAV